MANEFIIKNGFHSKGDSQVTGSLTATSFVGDGSGLSNLPASNPFPFTGDAEITGSLIVSGSLHAFTLDSDSVILGKDAGKHAAATAENNVIIGVSAGVSASNDNNVLIGKQAGEQVTGDGSDNIFIGFQAGQKGADKQENIAIGRNAHMGYSTGDTSDSNVSIGYYAGRLFQNSNLNTAIGYYAGHGNGSGGSNALRNVFLGAYAGYNHWNGIQDNIYVGYYAGAFNQQGDRNIIIGSGSTANGNPSDQLRIGHADLHVISASLETGDIIFYNTASAPNFSGSFQGDGSQLTNLPASSVLTSSYTSEWVLGASGTDHYTFSGPGLTGAENDPDIYLVRGQKYRFYNNSGGHPFRIQSTPNGSTGTAYNDGVTNNDAGNGTYLLFDVQFDAPTKLYYQCTSHTNMGGPIYIADAIEHSGSFSGSFEGNGSGLTNLPASDPFPYSGSAIISSSGATASLTLEGSGSTIFNIQGSQGQLFSVTDDLLDEVFSVADISGDTLLSVSGSGLVEIPVGPLHMTGSIAVAQPSASSHISGRVTVTYPVVAWNYNTDSRDLWSDDYIKISWDPTSDFELNILQLGSGGEAVQWTWTKDGTTTEDERTSTGQFDWDTSFGSSTLAVGTIACMEDSTWPWYRVTAHYLDTGDPGVYFFVEKTDFK